MSRPPFPAAPQSGSGQPTQNGQPRRASAERRTMVIGRGISVHGSIQDAERLEVQGIVEAQMIQAIELSIAPGGMFRGAVEVEEAEISGTIDGTVTARGTLVVRATGRVLGTARCRRLQVEDGGQISGQIEMITESRPIEPPAAEPAI
jgi:cytoskeletal protein CcmA (bactofilin family)